jgi:1-deoxy-D-xylulose-5-phosphate synthase
LGALMPMAKEIAKVLEAEGHSVAIINPRSVKPLDTGTLEFFARGAEVVITLEDHVLMGGFGSVVLEELSNLGISTPVVRIGWPDQFVDHGRQDLLREKYGVTAKNALEKARPYLKKKAGAKSSVA